jgi:hypothetical protein
MNLEEIKHRFAGTDIRFSMSRMDFDWLIAEVERLQKLACLENMEADALADTLVRAEKAEAKLDNEHEAYQFVQVKLDAAEADLSACQERVRELGELIEYALKELICPMCVRLNPQHKNCTMCDDTRELWQVLAHDQTKRGK